MNLRDRLILAGYQDHFETFNVGTPIPTAHPPSLKNPKRVKQPDEDYADAQERSQFPKRKRKKKRNSLKRKPNDMAYVMRKTLNQGRHVMVNHSHGGDPNLWNPSQIADL